jgi:chemotaxis protein methyltransferase CheR
MTQREPWVALAADVVAAIARRLAEHAGLELPGWVIDARANARIATVGCSPADYVALIDSARGAGELAALIEAVRVGESRLFRHQAQIDALASVFVPAMRARPPRGVRVWSAGCAAGEEPYTLAIVLSRALPDHTVRIHATDVSSEAIARARTASYPRAALDHVPAAYRDCFVRDGDRVRVVPEIAELVEFERVNLIDRGPPRVYQLVWCRNVLIYFTAEARRAAIDTLVRATERGGLLFVGYSESLRDVDGLEARSAGDTVYYVRTDANASPRGESPAERAVRESRHRPPMAADRTPRPVAADRTPPPMPVDRAPAAVSRFDRPTRSTLALRGQPTAAELAAEISARLAQHDLEHLTIDLDGAEVLDDELVRVLRRARAAAWTAGVAFGVDATRPGAVRWLSRHGFGDRETIMHEFAPPGRPSGGDDPASES